MDKKFTLLGYNTTDPTRPCRRDTKPEWNEMHDKQVALVSRIGASVLLFGDSLIASLSRYFNVWNKHFKAINTVNCGIGGDCVQNVLWRIKNMCFPNSVKFVVIHCGTNNIDRDTAYEIAKGVVLCGLIVLEHKPDIDVIITGLLPRDLSVTSRRRERIVQTNTYIEQYCQQFSNLYYMKQDNNWILNGGQLNESLYSDDFLHLSEDGYNMFGRSIVKVITNIIRTNLVMSEINRKPPIIESENVNKYASSTDEALSGRLLNEVDGSKTKVRKRYSEKLAKQLQSIGVNVDLVSGLEQPTASKNNPVSEERPPRNDASNICGQDDVSIVDVNEPVGNVKRDESKQTISLKERMMKIADETLDALDACNSKLDPAEEEDLNNWDPMAESYHQKGFNSYQELRYNDNFMEKHTPIYGPDGKAKISPTKSSSEDLRLFIANIPISLTEEGLRNMFSSVGHCRDVKKLRVREGELTGVGFVTYTSVREAENAILKYNDYQFGNDIKLRVKLAREKVPESHEELQWGTPIKQTDDSHDSAGEARKAKLKSILKNDNTDNGLGIMDRDIRYPAGQKDPSPCSTSSTRLFKPPRAPLTPKEKRAEADYYYDKMYDENPFGDDQETKVEVTSEIKKAEVRSLEERVARCNAESTIPRVEARQEKSEERRVESNSLHKDNAVLCTPKRPSLVHDNSGVSTPKQSPSSHSTSVVCTPKLSTLHNNSDLCAPKLSPLQRLALAKQRFNIT